MRVRRPGESSILFDTADAGDMTTLGTALDAEVAPYGMCMCAGTLVFDVERVGAAPVAVTLHHGVSLRWNDSKGNVSLRSPDAIMDWLSARGMTFVREEYDESERRGEETAEQQRRWHDAMPVSLRPFLDDMRQSGAGSRPEWTAAVEQEFPDPITRAAVLLELYGSGVGPWSGFPSWESVPEELLLVMPIEVLLAAVGDASSPRMCEGAARLFCGWSFRKRRKQLRRMPDELRRVMLEHVEWSGDESKIIQARSALTSKAGKA